MYKAFHIISQIQVWLEGGSHYTVIKAPSSSLSLRLIVAQCVAQPAQRRPLTIHTADTHCHSSFQFNVPLPDSEWQ